jgi:hypothetical protein
MLSDNAATNNKRSLSLEIRDMPVGTAWGSPPQSSPTKRSRRSEEEQHRPEDAAGLADTEVNNQVSVELPKMDCLPPSAAGAGV